MTFITTAFYHKPRFAGKQKDSSSVAVVNIVKEQQMQIEAWGPKQIQTQQVQITQQEISKRLWFNNSNARSKNNKIRLTT